MCRYIGVVDGQQLRNLDAQPGSRDKVAFEWRLESSDDVRLEVVHPRLDDVLRRGVPVPDCGRQAKVAVVADMEELAHRSSYRARKVISQKVGSKDLEMLWKGGPVY